jgi:hypothetical protein
MAAVTPITVHVEKPVGVHFSECFAEMRMWLTARSITPVALRKPTFLSESFRPLLFAERGH